MATCDKGLPAMMIALAGIDAPIFRPCIDSRWCHATGFGFGEDAGAGSNHRRPLSHTASSASSGGVGTSAAAPAARPGGGCQFLGTAATAQVVSGGAWPVAAALPRSRRRVEAVWKDMPRAVPRPRWCSTWPKPGGITTKRRPHRAASVRNAMAVHAAFGGSTNLLLHLPCRGFRRGSAAPHRSRSGLSVNRRVPRLVDVLPNGPRMPSDRARVSAAGGVPEVMLHLQPRLGLLANIGALTASRRSPSTTVLDCLGGQSANGAAELPGPACRRETESTAGRRHHGLGQSPRPRA